MPTSSMSLQTEVFQFGFSLRGRKHVKVGGLCQPCNTLAPSVAPKEAVRRWVGCYAASLVYSYTSSHPSISPPPTIDLRIK
ncbi:hypothetical protein IAS59_002382 [Cryptococcus gattii]